MKGMGRGLTPSFSLAYLTCKPCATSVLFEGFLMRLTPSFSDAFYL